MPMTHNDLREGFLSFFEKRGHVRKPSDSLVPTNDPTLLFTGAGMNQFKEHFLGRADKTLKRATTCQKCLRTGDIDNVGRTPAHQTFFEMLGNFSFGDYFKREAIAWAWELVTKVLRIDPKRLRVSVYEDDQEAYDIWAKEVKIRSDWIFRFDAKENFWPSNAPKLGPNGPCGPCSEIFYDQGEAAGCGKSDCSPACDCRRYFEIYNLVFTQFDRQGDGTLQPLPQKNIDTGMGLERTLAALHGAPNSFETDLFRPILARIEDIGGKRYETKSEQGRRMRRIADHARAIAFCVADGVLPSNEGRGYVERRLLRIATIDGRALGIDGPFLHQLVPVVAAVMERPYPEVAQRRETIARIVKAEEEKFADTLASGLHHIHEVQKALQAKGVSELPGEEIFRLYDTYGIPPEVTAQVTGTELSPSALAKFEEEMEKQREIARGASSMTGDIFVSGAMGKIRETISATDFLGYETASARGRIRAIIRDNNMADVAVPADGEVTIVLDRTPFYPEQGGQVGDTGRLHTDQAEFVVTETRNAAPHVLHVGKVAKGAFLPGDEVTATVDAGRREDIKRNHTATHLLHAALRAQFGEHAEQSGSLVAPDHLRFDFHHFEAPTKKDIEAIERRVNEKILENVEIRTSEMPIDEARKTGAKALFGEKYGERVRVVAAGEYSRELCGGTHCERTGNIGQFKITSEESVASGIRRITAVTGRYALDYWKDVEECLRAAAEELKAPVSDVVKRAQTVTKELKDLRKQLEKSRGGERSAQIAQLLESAPSAGGVKVIVALLEDVAPEELRAAVDAVKKSNQEAAVVLASVSGGKVSLIAYAGKKAQGMGLDAGKAIREVAKVVGGGGGGRPEMAQAGGTDVSKVNDALDLAQKLIREKLAGA